MKIEQSSENVTIIEFENKTIHLIGTAHISQQSVDLVKKTITKINPDKICIELDQSRYTNLTNESKFENMDIFKIIKEKKMPLFISQFFLSIFQKKMSEKTNSKPGQEFITAIEIAQSQNIDIELIDRDISITLKRLWRLLSLWRKMRLFFSMFLFEDEDITETKIEELKKEDMLNELILELGKDFPEIKKTLIEERDLFMTHQIQKSTGQVIVAVVGAGHVPGMLALFQNKKNIASEEVDNISLVPARSIASKTIPWLIPLLIFSIFAWGFSRGDYNKALDAMYAWIIINGTLSAIGCALALAHPLTILIGFIAAPITSLNPTIGAGFVTSIVQTFLVKPRVKDFLEIKESSFSLRQWWKNRLTRIFLVFIFSSLGSAVGTWIALPYLTQIFK